MGVSQVLSSWILVTISVDRWIRTRFPYKSNILCTPKKALIVVGILLVMVAGLHAHMLTPLFGTLAPGFANGACGPALSSVSYVDFYVYNWYVVQVSRTKRDKTYIVIKSEIVGDEECKISSNHSVGEFDDFTL